MKKLSVIYTVLLGSLLSLNLSCTKNFGDINTDPGVVPNPDLKFLLSYAEDKMVTYRGTEWVWEDMEQLFRYTQHMTASPFEVSGNNVNTRYRNYYLQILPNLFEIRRQIDMKPDKEKYQKMAAVTYVLQALNGIRVTDMNGSIPYSQAVQGRYESDFSPAYDNQQSLFDTWLAELNNAISVLSNGSLENQESYFNGDIFYKSDWTKWVKLANTIKLRIAARLENQDASKTAAIFKEVMQDNIGPIDNDDAQLSYQSKDYLPFGTSGDINYRSPRYGSTSIVSFMKKTNDPRIGIYFSKNDLVGSFADSLSKYSASLPSFINPADPLIAFQGAPADWNVDPAVTAFIANQFVFGNNDPGNSQNRYFLISPVNRLFFSPKYNNSAAEGEFRDVVVTNAESCLLVAEFIQKGYGSGIDTRGTAEDWYNKGIASSIKTMNDIAKAAKSTEGLGSNADGQINDFLDDANVKLNGVNDLERIYIQQYLNFFRNANEAFVLVRRTGYPKKTSTYYAREVFNADIPRRWWLTDPGEVNRANWRTAMTDQGFTENAQDIPTLSTQWIWYDKNAPAFGEGN
ncbi:MAG: SusD/RagB family nutrient-binding outer membrane lipoprotein [Chitinophagaceae bacterium]|nr:SusD/RagB family nutrient-binding outer membrane lipoprotein [Chitinophagaceae bacterium]